MVNFFNIYSVIDKLEYIKIYNLVRDLKAESIKSENYTDAAFLRDLETTFFCEKSESFVYFFNEMGYINFDIGDFSKKTIELNISEKYKRSIRLYLILR